MRALLLAAVVCCTACSAEPAADRGDDIATPSAAAAASAESPIARPETPPAMLLAVDGEGLRLVNSKTGSTKPLPFRTDRAGVLKPLEALRGPPGSGLNADCGTAYANWPDGLGLNFRDERFVGWSLDGRAAGAITTLSGVGPGSTLAEIREPHSDVVVERSTLGVEFSAGGFAGLLDGDGPDARVVNLWAGDVCLAR